MILDLFAARGDAPIDVPTILRCGEIFGLSSNGLRVALTRLVASGTLEAVSRGRYVMTRAAEGRRRVVSSWRRAEAAVVPWTGGWLGVVGVSAGRRTNVRPLELMGYRTTGEGLWLRPDNLTGGMEAARDRLEGWGFSSFRTLMEVRRLEEVFELELLKQWSVAETARAHADLRETLEESAQRLDALPLEEAARETFLLGGSAIRALLLDPYLPEQLADPSRRRALAETMSVYDELGKAVWARAFGWSETRPAPFAGMASQEIKEFRT